MLHLSEIFKVYELFREDVGVKESQELVGAYALSDGIATAEDAFGNIIGAALFLHVSDPYDVKLNGQSVKESPSGRYVYFSQLYVRPDHRDALGKTMWELIYKSFERCPGAIRWAFRRFDRGSDSLHVRELSFNFPESPKEPEEHLLEVKNG